jgi:hypothetical protein
MEGNGNERKEKITIQNSNFQGVYSPAIMEHQNII